MAYAYDTVPLTDKTTARAFGKLAAADPTDDVLDFLIDSATSLLENECDRHFVSRGYAGWHDGTDTDYLTLPEWPLNSVSRVSLGTLDALSVICDDSDATEAYAEVNAAGTLLKLTILDGPNAGIVDLALATYTPLSALATQIGLTAGTWTGIALSTYENYRSSMLRPTGRRECYESVAYFQIPNEGEADYTVDYDYGEIHGIDFPQGRRNIYVEYNAGYEIVPAALIMLCNEIVLQMYRNGKRDMALKSERLGDYQWAAAEGMNIDLTADDMARRIAPFRDNII